MEFRPNTDPDSGDPFLFVSKRGENLLKDPLLNKGTAFNHQEREALGLIGLLPDHVATIEEQTIRVREQLAQKTSDIERNIYLNGLMDRNETLFYRYVLEHLEETVPIIYTPTVAYACSHWSRIYRRARGIYITPRDRGRVAEVLQARESSPEQPVIVVTDNERILGIGDQGAGGMGIPIGKLALYTTAAGIHPSRTVPISLDVGTDNPELLADPIYLGIREPRLRGEPYFELVEEFIQAVPEVFPGALVQWEDFGPKTSFTLLERYQKVVPSFNDDIEGTAAMVVAGLLAAVRHGGTRLADHRVVVVGAGSAGAGIREQVAAAMIGDGLNPSRVTEHLYVLDSRGLLVDGRPDLTEMKSRLAVGTAQVTDWQIDDHPIGLRDVVRNAGATVLIGVSGVPGIFNEEIISTVAQHAERPIIMPLSNPTSHAEVTPANALRWTHGSAIVATGSPFPPVEYDGAVHRIGQANNVFIFPGMGLGVLCVQAKMVTTPMFLAAARALADSVSEELLATGQLYPEISEVRRASRAVAIAVGRAAIEEGVAEPLSDLEAVIDDAMWYPEYVEYRPQGD